MTSTLWIAVGAAALMVAAHILLFWWFLARPEKVRGNSPKKSDPGCPTEPGHEEAPGD